MEENAEQKAKAAAEKKEKGRAKDLDLAASAWEIIFLKILGYTKDSGKEATVKEIDAFAGKNIPDFKNHVMPDKTGRKNKPEKLLALSKFVRVQQPEKHWIDSDGKPADLIVVPERYVIVASEPAAPPEAAPAESDPPPAVTPGQYCPTGLFPCIPPAAVPVPAPAPAPAPALAPAPTAGSEAALFWLAQMFQAPGAFQ